MRITNVLWFLQTTLPALCLLATAATAHGQRLYANIDRATGEIEVLSTGDLEVDGYTITSPGGLLDLEAWTSLTDQAAPGWSEANPRSEQISELNWEGSGTITAGAPVSLGTAYMGAGVFPVDEELGFEYSTPDGVTHIGGVIYSGPSQVPGITVNRESGEIEVSNPLGFEITAYSIGSASGGLSPDGFAGLQDQSVAGWEEANPTATLLSELNLSASTVVDGTSSFSVGNAFVPGGPEDLVFEYLTVGNEIAGGLVVYEGPPSDLTLAIDLLSGEATIQNLSSVSGEFDIIGYSVTSESGSLSVDDWNGFSDSGLAGEGWAKANPSGGSLAELNPSGVSALFDTGTSISIGNIFTGVEDLVFEYGTPTGSAFGAVEYVFGGEAPTGVDCNGDGVTDAGDLSCVTTIPDRDAVLAVLGTLPGDLDGDGEVGFNDFLTLSGNFGDMEKTAYTDGDIDLAGDGPQFADFLTLSGNFGKTPALAASVPEPSGSLLAVLGLLICLSQQTRRR